MTSISLDLSSMLCIRTDKAAGVLCSLFLTMCEMEIMRTLPILLIIQVCKAATHQDLKLLVCQFLMKVGRTL